MRGLSLHRYAQKYLPVTPLPNHVDPVEDPVFGSRPVCQPGDAPKATRRPSMRTSPTANLRFGKGIRVKAAKTQKGEFRDVLRVVRGNSINSKPQQLKSSTFNLTSGNIYLRGGRLPLHRSAPQQRCYEHTPRTFHCRTQLLSDHPWPSLTGGLLL
jgi:hypothetical protein